MRIRRRTRVIVGALALLAVGVPSLAGAAPFTPATAYEPISFVRFCADSQGIIANLNQERMDEEGITVGGSLWSDFTPFQFSKSSVDTEAPKQILTTQYVSYRDDDRTQPDMIRCKYRTGESLDKGAWAQGEQNNGVGYEVEPSYGFGATDGAGLSDNPALDQTCDVVNQRTIDTVWDTLTTEDKAAAPFNPELPDPTLITEADTVATIGPEWTSDFPTYKLVGGKLVIPSKTLIAETTATPARFTGAHYCTLIAPTYLRDILLNDATVS